MPRTKRLFLTEAEVDELLDMGLALKALEEVFKARLLVRCITNHDIDCRLAVGRTILCLLPGQKGALPDINRTLAALVE